jgi:hypothetical protein
VDVDGRNPPGLDIVTINEQKMKWNDYAVGEKSKALTGGIKQTQCVGVVADHYGDRVVIKHLGRRLRKKNSSPRTEHFTVGTYSLGNLLVVYEIKRQVL